MNLSNGLISSLLIVIAAISSMIAWFAWWRKLFRGNIPFVLLNFSVAIWCFFRGVAIQASDTSTYLFLTQLQYIGVVNIPPLWLLFTLDYSDRRGWLWGRRMLFIWIIPILTLIIVFTNQWHGLFWTKVNEISEQPVFVHGAWFWVSIVYFYGLILIGAITLLRGFQSYPQSYRPPVLTILGGLLFPWLANMYYVTRVGPGNQMDITPLTFALSDVVFAFAIFRFQLLEVLPVARSQLIEQMNEGVLVLDEQNRIIDFNPAAQKMFNLGRKADKRVYIHELLPAYAHLFDSRQKMQETNADILLKNDGVQQFFSLRVTPLFREKSKFCGRLVIFQDITERIQAEQKEREQRILAEALRDSVAALNSTMNVDEIFDLILLYAGRVVPHDAANITLIDEQNMIYIERCRGYREFGSEEFMHAFRLSLSNFPNCQKMMETRKPNILMETSVEHDWTRFPETDWIKSYISVPIIVRDKVIGFLNLDSATANFFQLEQVDRLKSFADEAAVALERAQLFAETTRRAEQMATVNEIGLALTAGLDLKQVLKTLLTQCQKVVSTDVFYIALYDEKTGSVNIALFYDKGEFREIPTWNIHERGGMTAYIIQTRKTLYIQDTLDPQFIPAVEVFRFGGIPARSYIGVPLILKDRVVGVISIQSYKPNAYSPDQIRLLEIIATQASVAIQNAQIYAQMEQLATTDTTTGVFSRFQFTSLAAVELERAERFGNPMALIMIDFDLFKQVNDEFGHVMGDQVLKKIMEICKETLRAYDILGRYGGDEFVILLPETTLDGACEVAERLRTVIENADMCMEVKSIRIAASFGVAVLTSDCRSLRELLIRADKALYTAKQSGRNCVKAYNPHLSESIYEHVVE